MDIPSYGFSSQGEYPILTVMSPFIPYIFNALIAYFMANIGFGYEKMNKSQS